MLSKSPLPFLDASRFRARRATAVPRAERQHMARLLRQRTREATRHCEAIAACGAVHLVGRSDLRGRRDASRWARRDNLPARDNPAPPPPSHLAAPPATQPEVTDQRKKRENQPTMRGWFTLVQCFVRVHGGRNSRGRERAPRAGEGGRSRLTKWRALARSAALRRRSCPRTARPPVTQTRRTGALRRAAVRGASDVFAAL